MNKAQPNTKKLHTKTNQHAEHTKQKAARVAHKTNNAVDKVVEKSSELMHQGIDLVARVAKSVREHLPK
ncbi:MAG TPA: hypothetical protein VD770_03390 [Coxiellaceae bacterium]|nr:hypothetical protein [Coxiellaceae bacterium]